MSASMPRDSETRVRNTESEHRSYIYGGKLNKLKNWRKELNRGFNLIPMLNAEGKTSLASAIAYLYSLNDKFRKKIVDIESGSVDLTIAIEGKRYVLKIDKNKDKRVDSFGFREGDYFVYVEKSSIYDAVNGFGEDLSLPKPVLDLLRSSAMKIREIRDEIERLSKKVGISPSELDAKKRELNELQKRLSEINDKLHTINNSITALQNAELSPEENEIVMLVEGRETDVKRIEELSKKIAEIEKWFDEVIDELNKRGVPVASKEAVVGAAETKQREVEKDYMETKDSLESLNAKLKRYNEIANAAKAIHINMQYLRNIATELDTETLWLISSEINSDPDDISKAIYMVYELTRILPERLSEQARSIGSEAKGVGEKLKQLEAEMQFYSKIKHSADENLTMLKKYRGMKSMYENDLQRIDDRINQLGGLEYVIDRYKHIQEKLLQRSKEIEELKRKRDELESEKRKIEDRIETLKVEIEKREELLKKAEALGKELENKNKEYAEYYEELKRLVSEIDDKLRKIYGAYKEKLKLNADIKLISSVDAYIHGKAKYSHPVIKPFLEEGGAQIVWDNASGAERIAAATAAIIVGAYAMKLARGMKLARKLGIEIPEKLQIAAIDIEKSLSSENLKSYLEITEKFYKELVEDYVKIFLVLYPPAYE
jgi:predicted  nucleic acid-binding Zn-ribbon protein